jgi:hypothetical protein
MTRSNALEVHARAEELQNAVLPTAARAREEFPIEALPIEALQSAVLRNGVAIRDGSARRR